MEEGSKLKLKTQKNNLQFLNTKIYYVKRGYQNR